ncbi:hypothetical protein R2R35_22835 [Anaerocolumna sp. AGMB13020]|uniref:hypothetical protein n=1 Tax=Anaerocolumna sp. AGMB13020 TaxID=3081750 RepID=UPI002953B773|nr:hypothetical protein [Anaerocolumna sp. AGMB13020]WOO36594.1 hypothetical protein R2R35_22835 [Anaerocolumna sp. AGMB13020]
MNDINELLIDNGISIHHKNNQDYFCSIYNIIPQDDYVLLELENESYSLYEIHRGQKIYKIKDNDKEKAIILGIVLYKKMNDSVTDREKVRIIKNLVSKGDEKLAITYFGEFDDNIYSIGTEERMKISLIKGLNGTSVVYDKKYIVEDVTLCRAYVVLYNYCKNLKEILSFYHTNKDFINGKNIDVQEMIKLYIF